MKSPKPIKAGF